jgi:hypothetical protein
MTYHETEAGLCLKHPKFNQQGMELWAVITTLVDGQLGYQVVSEEKQL